MRHCGAGFKSLPFVSRVTPIRLALGQARWGLIATQVTFQRDFGHTRLMSDTQLPQLQRAPVCCIKSLLPRDASPSRSAVLKRVLIKRELS